ncbi:MAG: outer membrane protein assembly factor BamA [Candidatus Omnitrophota bacterium]
MLKRISLIITVIFFIAGSVFAQGSAKRIVRKVEVLNNKVVSVQTILSKLQTRPDREYSAVALSDDIKRLYATGLFDDVSAEVADIETGVKVIFKVKEKPILDEIVFTGQKKIKKSRLLSKMKVKKNEIFDQFKLKEDIETLKKFYAEKGFSLAVIDYVTEEKDNKIRVTIKIEEKQRVRIRKITFIGNKEYKDKRLLKLIKTRRKGFLSSGLFKEDVLEDDLERIVAFYHQGGFIDAKVSSEVDYNQKKTKMFIAFNIDEGKRYKIRQVVIKGNKIFKKEELEKTFELTKDTTYTEEKIRLAISNIQSYYFDRGYIAATVKVDTVVEPETAAVDVGINIAESGIAYVDKINIEGNTRSKEVIIRREMRLYPGDRYNGEKLKRSRQRLYNLGYFQEVTFDTAEKPTTLPDKYDLDVFVKETKTGEFSFGAGYSSIDDFIGFVDLTQRNFDLFNFPTFTGGGQRLRIRTELGSKRKDYELSFVEPWFLGYPVEVGFNIYQRTRDWDKYDEKRTGFNAFVGKEFGEYWSGKLTYRYEGIRLSDLTDDASREIRAEEGKNNIRSLTTDITHDSRDNVYNPTKGLYNRLSCEVAGSIFGGDKDFVKYYTQNSKYFPLSEKAVFELEARAGLVEAFSTTQDVPVYERFYAGGANTIRGYKERRVGPEGEYGDPIGGRLMFIFNAEYTYQLAKTLKWAFFYDIGNVWANRSQFSLDDLKLKAAVGTGIRLKTPLGPIKLDYGRALHVKPGDKRGRFHFSMSHEF